jgi:hypothetical protein
MPDRRRPRLYCPPCERRAARAVDLGVISDDGRVGTVRGFACYSCRRIREAPGAAPVFTARITDDLGGRPAGEFFLDRLRRLGRDPRPIPEP